MKSETKFKETEIGRIPEEWNVKELQDCVDLIIDYRGKTPKKLGGDWSNKGYRALSARNIKQGRIVDKDSIRFMDEVLYKNWMKDEIQRGDALITSEGPLGECMLWDSDEKIVLSQRLFAVRINKTILDSSYFYCYVSSKKFQHELSSRATGTTVSGIRQSELIKTKISIPPIEEQKAIAKILSDLDSKVEINIQMNKNLEAIGQTIFKHWFVDFEFPNNEGKPYKSSGGEMVDSELGEMPKGWSIIENISDICDKINYGYTQSASKKIVGPKFLRVTDINKGDWINWNSVPYCEIGDKDLAKYILKRMDIVIARMADPGKLAIFESHIRTVFASYLIRIRFKDPLQAYYLYYLMKSRYYQNYILGASIGTVQKSLNAKELTNGLSIVIPDKAILRKFNDVIILLRGKVNINLSENNNLSRIRESLLPCLMSGRIRTM